MLYKGIYVYKDNMMSAFVTDIPKESLKGQMLMNGIEAKKIKNAKIGDILEIECNGDIFFGLKVSNVCNCDIKNRINNLEKAYFHFLDCVDCGSHDLTKTVNFIEGNAFPDQYITSKCYLMLESYKKLLVEALKTEDNSKQKLQLKKLKEILKNYDAFETNLFGIKYEGGGYKLADVPDVIPYYRQKYGLKKESAKDVLAIVHKKTLMLMYGIGNDVFFTNKQFEK